MAAMRYERVERVTLDNSLARIATDTATASGVGGVEAWATQIIHVKALRRALFDPKRTALLSVLEMTVMRFESSSTARAKEVNMTTPAVAPVVAPSGDRASRSQRARTSAERCPRGLSVVRMCVRVRSRAVNC